MHDERSADALTDAALDAEIAGLLTVDPSPQFVARVRTQIAQESPRSDHLRFWVWTAVAAAVAAIAIVAFVRSGSNRGRPIETLSARSEIRIAPMAPGRASSLSVEAPQPTAAGRTQRIVHESREPEVLILARDAIALRELVRIVSGGRAPLPLVVDAAITSADNAIKPIVIEPLAITAGEEGEHP
jgi:hypothetical protein